MLLVSMGTACAGHVGLPAALPRSAPFEQRLAMARAYAAVGAQTTVFYNRYGGTSGVHLDHVELGNGMTVAHPDDLIPLVGEDSPTGHAAHQSSLLNDVSTAMYCGSVFGVVGGFGVGGGGFGVDSTPLGATGLTIAATGLLTFIAAYVVGRVANGQRNIAFETYEPSLNDRLGICTVGVVPVDCAQLAAMPIHPTAIVDLPRPRPIPAPPPLTTMPAPAAPSGAPP